MYLWYVCRVTENSVSEYVRSVSYVPYMSCLPQNPHIIIAYAVVNNQGCPISNVVET